MGSKLGCCSCPRRPRTGALRGWEAGWLCCHLELWLPCSQRRMGRKGQVGTSLRLAPGKCCWALPTPCPLPWLLKPLHPPPSLPCTWEPGLLSPDLRPWLGFLAPVLVFSPWSRDSPDGAGAQPTGLSQLSSRSPLDQSSQQTASGRLLRAGQQGPGTDGIWSVPLTGG